MLAAASPFVTSRALFAHSVCRCPSRVRSRAGRSGYTQAHFLFPIFHFQWSRCHPHRSPPQCHRSSANSHMEQQKHTTPVASFPQSYPNMWERHNANARVAYTFQSTPPHWGATQQFQEFAFQMAFQSTPPHGGRRPYILTNEIKTLVSIHAPAWGATDCSGWCINWPCFNPRPRMGGDSR